MESTNEAKTPILSNKRNIKFTIEIIDENNSKDNNKEQSKEIKNLPITGDNHKVNRKIHKKMTYDYSTLKSIRKNFDYMEYKQAKKFKDDHENEFEINEEVIKNTLLNKTKKS